MILVGPEKLQRKQNRLPTTLRLSSRKVTSRSKLGIPIRQTNRSCGSIMGSHWPRAACSDQVQNRPSRVVELGVWLGRDPACENSKQVERKRADHESPASLRIRPKTESKSCSWGTASPWILWWRRESVRCSHFPPLGVNEWKFQVRSCPDQFLCCKKKSVPILELMGCLTLTRMNVTAVRKHPRLPKNLLGGLLYRLVLNKDPITKV